jgi:hypothetical protein
VFDPGDRRRTVARLIFSKKSGGPYHSAIPKIVVGATTVLLLIAGSAHANVYYSIGNSQPSSEYFVQGESFTPSVQGNDGSGTPSSAAGQVGLISFTIDFVNPASVPSSLYIYASLPSVTDADSGTGSLATGSYAGNGVYDFATPVSLSFASTYGAWLPEARSIYDGSGNKYTGGTDLYVSSGVIHDTGAFDIGFTATFVVPEPPELLLFAGALVALFWLHGRSSRAT